MATTAEFGATIVVLLLLLYLLRRQEKAAALNTDAETGDAAIDSNHVSESAQVQQQCIPRRPAKQLSQREEVLRFQTIDDLFTV